MTKMVLIVPMISEVGTIIFRHLFCRAFCNMACVYMKEHNFIELVVSLVSTSLYFSNSRTELFHPLGVYRATLNLARGVIYRYVYDFRFDFSHISI